MSHLKIGKFITDYKLSNLVLDNGENGVNRSILTENVEDKKQKLEDFGWLVPVVITEKGLVLEGQHRVEAAISMGQRSIPVYIVDWVQDEDVDEVRDVVISLNSGNRAWTQWDYIKSYKNSKQNYRVAYEACIKYSKTLTNGLVVTALFGIGSMNQRFKNGDSELKNQSLHPYLLETSSSLVSQYGKSNFPAQTIRTFMQFAHKNSEDIGLINYVVNFMKNEIKQGRRVEDGDMGLRNWFNMLKESYESITNK